jgi:hypothetical protein
MAQAGPEIPRRSIFAALLAAPIIATPIVLANVPPLQSGHIWVQVPERAWRDLIEAARSLNGI